ncbi:MAG: BspA family leucine-rich repeat surface protein [Proteobacteria bacterium]|nr:BspA family leucine-rich repeat surface protein [Pseudomonadota bacterium]
MILSSVTSMKRMFQDASSFNQPLEKWDVSNVTNMSGMFNCAVSFNQPLEKWDVSNVQDMSRMFDDAELMAHKPSWLSHKDG